MKNYRFVRARLSTGGNDTTETTVTVRDGVIEAIGSDGAPSETDIDLHGNWLLPGAIDGHVHFDDPGYTEREDFASGTRAASAGGVTTIVDMPCTSVPEVIDAARFQEKLAVILPKARVDFRLWGGVRGNDFSPEVVEHRLRELRELGVRSVKAYLISGMDTFQELKPDQLTSLLSITKKLNLLVGVHAEDATMVREASREARLAPDATSPASYARARSAEAERKGIETCIQAAEQTGARLHVVHLACGEGVEMIRQAQARGVNVTTETCPHYLTFTREDLLRLGSLLKTAPVVKSASDREKLWEGLQDGTISMVATDHAAGKWPEEKHTGSIWTDYGGVPGVEWLLPFLLTEGVHAGRITLARAIELLSQGPANVHRLKGKGQLAPGFDADFAVVDPDMRWTVSASESWTRQKYTPLEGRLMQGRVLRTFVRGREVFRYPDGPIGEAVGQHIGVEWT